MAREVLWNNAAPGSALYAQGTKNGPFIYVSGMVGIDPTTGQLAEPPARYVARLGVTLPDLLVSIRMTALTA